MSAYLSFILMVLIIQDVYACKCMSPSTFQEEYKNSDQIFVGRVLRKDSAYEVYYLFQTISVYKGRETDTVTIRSGFGGPDCGIVMEIGQSYLIYARSKYTGRCSRTGIANDHPDVVRLTFLLDTALANQIGKSDAVKLNHNESVYNHHSIRKANGK